MVDLEYVQYHPGVLKGYRLAMPELCWAYGATLGTGDAGPGLDSSARAVQEAAEASGGSVELRGAWDAEMTQDRLFNTWYRVKQLTGLDM